MIILLDRNIWEKLVKFVERDIVKSGTLILQDHLHDSQFLHWVKDMGGKRVLGVVELAYLSRTDIDEISPRYVKAAGFPSKETLKRIFLTFSKEVSAITVAEMRIAEIERYWCPGPECQSVNLNFLNKDIFKDQLPFSCFDCGVEFYTPNREEGSRRITLAWLEKRYCQDKIKRIPASQQAVIAIAGENWIL